MPIRIGTPEEAGMSPERLRHVAQLAQGWVAQGMVRTLVVAVARRGILVLHEAYGTLGPEQDSPPAPLDTVFPLMSISKPITATAAMMLVEQGRLGLNRPVVEYIPEFVGEGKSAVTLWHLLTHTSGMREEDVDAHASTKQGSLPPSPLESTQHPAIHEYLRLRHDAPLWRAAGVEMSYSNHNYNLLGEIVRRVSGQSLPDYARERIFVPLDMRDTSYALPDAAWPRAVRRSPDDVAPYGFGTPALGSPECTQIPWGSAGAFATALDMARFGQMFLDHGSIGDGDVRVLSPASVAQMSRNQIPGIGAHFGEEVLPEASWGLGWAIQGDVRYPRSPSLSSPATFWHSGSGGTYMWVDPAYELVGVYFSVEPHPLADDFHDWPRDLFVNATTAAVLTE